MGIVIAGVGLFSCAPDDTSLELVGTVERKTLEVAAPISEVIVEIPVGVGDAVEANQIVVRLDSAVAEAELAASQASLAAAKAAESQAHREYQRIEGLQRARVSSRQDLDRAQRDRDESAAQVAERMARVVQAEKRLADLTLRSWGHGVLDELPFEVGERTSAGSVVAVLLADETPYVRVWIPARATSHVVLGTQARIEVEGLDEAISGQVEYISRESEFTPHFALTERESAHLVYEARIRLASAPVGLRAGLPARVWLNASTSRAAQDTRSGSPIETGVEPNPSSEESGEAPGDSDGDGSGPEPVD